MSDIDKIEEAISTLPREDFFRLRDWMRNRFEDEWDRQFEDDAKEGRLDALAEEALAEHRAGKSTPFPDNEE